MASQVKVNHTVHIQAVHTDFADTAKNITMKNVIKRTKSV